MKFKTLHTFDTIYSADSIEWCPVENFKEYFVCGTYQLCDNEENSVQSEAAGISEDTKNKKRKGRIYLFKYDLLEDDLKMVQQIDTEAILDQKWNNNFLIIANAVGVIQIYELDIDKLILKKSFNIESNYEDDVLALSVDFNNSRIITSDSKGGLTLLKLDQSNLNQIHNWNAHSFEAWSTIFDKWNENVVYSGGDDTFLNAFDTRCSENIPFLKWKNKCHGAGVTTLHSFAEREHILATGSYDEILRLLDIRQTKNSLTELNLNGGIWRIKPSPLDDSKLLCGCMYHNFSIVEIHKGNSNLELIGEYNEHGSICYGCDWCHLSNDNIMYVATCSFYDHKMCLSTVSDKEKVN